MAYGYRLLEAAGRKRGFLISGGEVDTERMAKILLDEFRAGKLGRFTLELPERMERRKMMRESRWNFGSYERQAVERRGGEPSAAWTRPGPAPWRDRCMPPP